MAVVSKRFGSIFNWSVFNWAIPTSLMGGIVLMVYLLLTQRDSLTVSSQVSASTVSASRGETVPTQTVTPEPELGPRHQLTYEQWVALLGREATAIAQQRPKRLYILAGDSLSLWFPTQSLPQGAMPQELTWLNQGISGETSYGLLHRVKLLDATRPKVIFVMIGINDLIHGVRKETLLANQREIVRHLKKAHPKAKIVIQSILPHGGDRMIKHYSLQNSSHHNAASSVTKPEPKTETEGETKDLRKELSTQEIPKETLKNRDLGNQDLEKEAIETTTAAPTPTANSISERHQPPWLPRLSTIPNTAIRKFNQRLAIMAREEKVEYLDLHRVFTDKAGNIQSPLTTDGLHLSRQGYEVWRSQLEKY